MLHFIKVDPRMGDANLDTIQDSLSFIMKSLESINENTYSYADFPSGLETVLTIIASLVTIAGAFLLGYEYYRRQVSKKCQKRIILDLIRHLMVNNAIIEVIKGGNIEECAYAGDGEMVNSDFLNGLSVEDAQKKIQEWLMCANAR